MLEKDTENPNTTQDQTATLPTSVMANSQEPNKVKPKSKRRLIFIASCMIAGFILLLIVGIFLYVYCNKNFSIKSQKAKNGSSKEDIKDQITCDNPNLSKDVLSSSSELGKSSEDTMKGQIAFSDPELPKSSLPSSVERGFSQILTKDQKRQITFANFKPPETVEKKALVVEPNEKELVKMLCKYQEPPIICPPKNIDLQSMDKSSPLMTFLPKEFKGINPFTKMNHKYMFTPIALAAAGYRIYMHPNTYQRDSPRPIIPNGYFHVYDCTKKDPMKQFSILQVPLPSGSVVNDSDMLRMYASPDRYSYACKYSLYDWYVRLGTQDKRAKVIKEDINTLPGLLNLAIFSPPIGRFLIINSQVLFDVERYGSKVAVKFILDSNVSYICSFSEQYLYFYNPDKANSNLYILNPSLVFDKLSKSGAFSANILKNDDRVNFIETKMEDHALAKLTMPIMNYDEFCIPRLLQASPDGSFLYVAFKARMLRSGMHEAHIVYQIIANKAIVPCGLYASPYRRSETSFKSYLTQAYFTLRDQRPCVYSLTADRLDVVFYNEIKFEDESKIDSLLKNEPDPANVFTTYNQFMTQIIFADRSKYIVEGTGGETLIRPVEGEYHFTQYMFANQHLSGKQRPLLIKFDEEMMTLTRVDPDQLSDLKIGKSFKHSIVKNEINKLDPWAQF